MKFLADMGIAMSTVEALRGAGHDAVHLREQGLHRLSDGEILEKARSENRTLLTFDLDFGWLLAAGLHQSPSVVIFRLHDATPAAVLPKLLEVVEIEGARVTLGSVVSSRTRATDCAVCQFNERAHRGTTLENRRQPVGRFSKEQIDVC
jgi:predicted nuclease of predicted toxin-antitoxin system